MIPSIRRHVSDLRDHVGLLNQQKCVGDQFSWFKSLGGLLCSTTVVCKRIVFITNASEKDVLFKAKFSLVRLLTFGLFHNRLLDPVGSRFKGER